MAEIATIARPYAEAVFQLADKAGTLDRWSEILERLASLAEHPEVQQIVGDPRLGASRLVDLIVSLAGEGGADAKPFIAALVENKRVEALPAIRAHYEALKNERQGAVDAKIETALEMTSEQLGALVADLEKKFGRRVRPQVSVDKELIGGARVTVGDQVIDGSVRGRLASLAAGLIST